MTFSKCYNITDLEHTTMDHNESRGLLKTILGFLARRTPEKSTPPTSLKSQALDAWVRTDAYLQHNADDFDEIDPERVASSLKTFENLVQYESNPEPGSVSIVSQHVPLASPS